MLRESDRTLLATAYSRASARVPAERSRVQAISQLADTAMNLFDGDMKTSWICRNEVTGPQWVTIELPAAKRIDRITISQSYQQPEYATEGYRIEGSLDGYTFETLAQGSLPAQSGASRMHEIDKPARFIRIVALSIHPNTAYSSPALSEVEIIADGKSIREWLRQ